MGPMYHFGLSEFFSLESAARAACGGALLGCVVIFRMSVLGQVVGISGITRSVMHKPSLALLCIGKAAFIFGLVLSGFIMSKTYGGLEPMPPLAASKLLVRLRYGLGGFLVGVGTAFGNGCTTGHGFTGLARLSARSWVAVPTFMGMAMLAATLSQTALIMPADPRTEKRSPPLRVSAALGLGLGALFLSAVGASYSLSRLCGPEVVQKAQPIFELLGGVGFGTGLVVSGMGKLSKAAGFLDLASGAWDPTLAFVMGSALLLTFPYFQFLERKIGDKSFTCTTVGCGFDLPPKYGIDSNLVIGAAVFGVGWGVCGACPGPGWVLLGAKPSLDSAILIGGMLCGLAVWVVWQRSKDAAPAKSGTLVLEPGVSRDETKGLTAETDVSR